jgi:hypothetical protein
MEGARELAQAVQRLEREAANGAVGATHPLQRRALKGGRVERGHLSAEGDKNRETQQRLMGSRRIIRKGQTLK